MSVAVSTRDGFCGCVERASSDGAKWGLKELTWCLAIPAYDRETQFREMVEVFTHISTVIDLKFRHVVSPAEANLVYMAGRGARAQLDGRLGTLAYAYLPTNSNYRGQLNCVFDLDERWDTEILFANVMYHETLHLLGLDHSRLKGQLMSPTYDRLIALPTLEDRTRMVRLYGSAKIPSVPAPVDPPTNDNYPSEFSLTLGDITYIGNITKIIRKNAN